MLNEASPFMMTSSSNTSPFRLTLLRISEVLTKENVQDLAFLCEDISPARRELITNARELFAALQGYDLLSERKVNILIDWLDELRLSEASKLLKEYRTRYRDEASVERCLDHEEQTMKYFCLSCDSKICPDCLYSAHNPKTNCEVIKLSEISDQVSKHHQNLIQEIEGAETSIISAKNFWKEKKDSLGKTRQDARATIYKEFLLRLEKAETLKRDLTQKVDREEVSDQKQLLEVIHGIQILEKELERLAKVKKKKTEKSSHDLQELIEGMKKIKSIRNQLDKQNEKLKVKPVDILYRKIPNDGPFCSITVGMLLGSVHLRLNQIIHTFNERKSSGGVLLICVDPKDSSKEYWRHLEKIDNHDDPVVMSNLAMYYDSGHHPLFAVGNTVFIVHPHRNGSLYDSVKSVSSMVIDEVPEGSWITSITAHRPNKNPNNEFIIFTSCDHSIREYNVSGCVLRVIYTRDFVRSNAISRVAYCHNLFAIIGRSLDDVILIDSDDTVKQCVTLRLPSTMSGMLPINIIWTCSRWLALYISKGVEKEWKVVDYGKTGEFVKVCVEGTSSNEMDVPLCVTRCANTGHVTLANTNVRIFQY
ncbi:hypothetical protein BSL78_05965 [Apostichopus japonicus]|uniref:B box-type domain-containing protein n=1 Tax=Stichopus japonicus TaxID=307972 RepID=A0A2G8LAA7_STIJA|nr:hypothetical protein BSL78_05965 [Apostichopus japonicus]